VKGERVCAEAKKAYEKLMETIIREHNPFLKMFSTTKLGVIDHQ